MNESAPTLSAIRARIQATFRELGIEDESTIREAVLIRDGLYVGRRFRAGPLHAIWMADENDFIVDREEQTVAIEVADLKQLRKAA